MIRSCRQHLSRQLRQARQRASASHTLCKITAITMYVMNHLYRCYLTLSYILWNSVCDTKRHIDQHAIPQHGWLHDRRNNMCAMLQGSPKVIFRDKVATAADHFAT